MGPFPFFRAVDRGSSANICFSSHVFFFFLVDSVMCFSCLVVCSRYSPSISFFFSISSFCCSLLISISPSRNAREDTSANAWRRAHVGIEALRLYEINLPLFKSLSAYDHLSCISPLMRSNSTGRVCLRQHRSVCHPPYVTKIKIKRGF